MKLPGAILLGTMLALLAPACAEQAADNNPTDPGASHADADISHAIEQLRHVVGTWQVTTEFLKPDGSVGRSVDGTYTFDWVVPDRVLTGKSNMPALDMASGILFYLNEKNRTIEMVSVGADGRLWLMRGPADSETRTTETYENADGSTGQLRFTRFNVEANRFESRMEYTSDDGASWLPGNHQVFIRMK